MRQNFYYLNRSKSVSTKPGLDRFIYLTLLVFLLVSSFTFAQTGTIKGTVTDKNTNDALIGANIIVQGTNLGAAADIAGNFIIYNVAAGDQVLVVSYIGYQSLTIKVSVEANSTNEVNIKMIATALEGKTVLVTAQAKGQLQAINQQLSSNNIINVVSQEKMQELPDANIAESIGRLPGVSIERNAGEANEVVVRGLSPQFNQVTIEGIPMSSTNYPSLSDMNNGSFTQDRSIDLSLLSDNLVQAVELSKTLRPDMDVNALGGTINLTLKTAQPGLHYNLMGNGGYNNLRNSYNNYKFAGTVGDRFLDDKIGVLVQGTVEEKQLPSDQFNATYALQTAPTTASSPFYINTNQAQLIDNTLKRQRYGASVILDYASDLVDIKFYNVYDIKIDSNITRQFSTNFLGDSFEDQYFIGKTKTEQRTHSLQALFKLSGTELPMSISYTKGDQSTPNAQEFDFYSSGTGTRISPGQLVYGLPASLINTQGIMQPNVSTLWDLFDSDPSLSDESYDAKIDWKVPFTLSGDFSGILSTGAKFHQTNRSSSNNRYYFDVQFGGSKGRRQNLVNEFPFLKGANLDNESGLPANYFVDPGYTRTNILGYPIGPSYDIYKLANVMNTIWPAWVSQFYTDGPESYNLNYTDKENTLAGYLMGEFNIGKNITLTTGVRWQQEETDISAYHTQLDGSNQNGLAGELPQLVDTKRDNPDWYPSVNIKYKATDNIQIIGAVYKSATLPSYSDISPMVEYSNNKTITTGNPLLQPSKSWNLDLGVSVFSNEVGLFTANIFYKDISNLIYGMQNFYPFTTYPMANAPSDISTRLPGKGYWDTTWAKGNGGAGIAVNIPMNDPADAYLRGIELSWQTHFWYLPWVLNGLVLDFNVSFMSSNQVYPSFQVRGPKIGNKDTLYYTTTSGTLQNQPKAIYNAILGWDYLGFSARFSASYQQTTLTYQDTRFGLQNYYYDNVFLMDISLKQQIINNLSVFANATNINEHIDNYYFAHPAYNSGTQIYPAGQLPTSGQTYGWNAQIGISYNY